MCTYATETLVITGAARRTEGWLDVNSAAVYFDHPVHARDEHTLNIDFRDQAGGPAARVGLELSAQSARALAEAILRTLNTVAPGS